MMKTVLFNNSDWKKDLLQAYTFRYKEAPAFVQCADHITTSVNPNHPEGFDNISLLFPETFSVGAKAKLRCSFDAMGCPEIILVEKPEKCEDGVVRYGACFEIVLYKDGVNIWRHYMDEPGHKCYWHLRVGLHTPVTEKDIHELNVEIIRDYIIFRVDDGVGVRLRTEDLPEKFYVGLTACEGIVRLYELQAEQGEI